MGLFSKKKTFVNAQTLSMIEDTPDLVGDSVRTSILKGTDIAPDLITNYLNCIYTKVGRYYSYGRDSYTHGLPQGSHAVLQANEIAVAQAIEQETGKRINLVTVVLDYCDGLFLATPQLITNQGYDPDSDVVTNPPAPPAEYPPLTTVSVIGAEVTGLNEVTVRYSYTDAAEVVHVYSVATTVMGANPDVYFYHVTYVEKGTTEPLLYWFYDTSTDVYSDLVPPKTTEDNSPYFPVAIVRENNHDIQEGDEAYDSTKSLLNIIGVDLDELVEGVNENPDQGDIDHAYVILGVDISSDLERSMEYMHDFFSHLYGLNRNSKDLYDNWVKNAAEYPQNSNTPPMQVHKITDSNYNVDICYGYITQEVKAGVIPNGIERVVEYNAPYEGASYSIPQDKITFRKQLDDTTYSEVVVFGILHVNHVYKSYTVDTSLGDAFYRDSEGDQTNGNFVIPLNRNLVAAGSTSKGNELMYDAIKIVFNSYEVVKLKWYQTGFFKVVAIIVAVVYTIYTFDAYNAGSLVSSIVGASTITGLGLSAFQLVLLDIVVGISIKYAVSFLAQYIPPELAMAFALAATFIQVGTAFGAPSTMPATMPTPEAGLGLTNLALSQANHLVQASTAYAFEELQVEMQEFQQEANVQAQELEELWEELEPTHDLDPMDIFTDFGQEQYFETPDTFIARTVHTPNPNSLLIGGIGNYVGNQLSLPTTAPELGVFINV